jgi:hypothetical protein
MSPIEGILLLAVILMRRAYAVFGALGMAIYLGHLADVVFKDSLLFPFAPSLIGITIVAAGLLYHREQERVAKWLTAHLPNAMLQLRTAFTPLVASGEPQRLLWSSPSAHSAGSADIEREALLSSPD